MSTPTLEATVAPESTATTAVPQKQRLKISPIVSFHPTQGLSSLTLRLLHSVCKPWRHSKAYHYLRTRTYHLSPICQHQAHSLGNSSVRAKVLPTYAIFQDVTATTNPFRNSAIFADMRLRQRCIKPPVVPMLHASNPLKTSFNFPSCLHLVGHITLEWIPSSMTTVRLQQPHLSGKQLPGCALHFKPRATQSQVWLTLRRIVKRLSSVTKGSSTHTTTNWATYTKTKNTSIRGFSTAGTLLEAALVLTSLSFSVPIPKQKIVIWSATGPGVSDELPE